MEKPTTSELEAMRQAWGLPKTNEVLDRQKEKGAVKPETETLLSPFAGLKSPTDIGLEVTPAPVMEETVSPEKENIKPYKFPVRVQSVIDVSLSKTTDKEKRSSLKKLGETLYHASSLDELEQVIEDAKNNGVVSKSEVIDLRYEILRVYSKEHVNWLTDHGYSDEAKKSEEAITKKIEDADPVNKPEVVSDDLDQPDLRDQAPAPTSIVEKKDVARDRINLKYASEARSEYTHGNIKEVLSNLSLIDNESYQADLVGEFVRDLIDKKDFDVAHDIIEVVKKPELKEEFKVQIENASVALQKNTPSLATEMPPMPTGEKNWPPADKMKLPATPEEDKRNGERAKNSYKAGNLFASISYSQTINDPEVQAEIISSIVDEMINKEKFDDARKIMVGMKNKERKEKLQERIQEVISKPASSAPSSSTTPIVKAEEKILNNQKIDLVPDPEAGEVPEVDLEKTRDEYAVQLIAYKNLVRERRNVIGKIYSDLGAEGKPIPEVESKYLDLAKEKYIQAKKIKVEKLLTSPSIDIVTLGEEVEKERDLLYKKIAERRSTEEKGVVVRGLQKWGQMSKIKRFALTTGVLAAGSIVSGVAVGAVAANMGFRAARTLAGAGASEYAGKKVDGIFKKQDKEIQEKILQEYSTGINEANYAQKEEELMSAFEKDQNRLKVQNFKRAAAMAGAAALTTGIMQGGKAIFDHMDVPSGGSLAASADHVGGGKDIVLEKDIPQPAVEALEPKTEILPTSTGVSISNDLPNVPKPVTSMALPEQLHVEPVVGEVDMSGSTPITKIPSSALKPHLESVISKTEKISAKPTISEGLSSSPKPKIHIAEMVTEKPSRVSAPEKLIDAKVPVSSRGFIQTIMDVKKKILEEYGNDENNVPENIKTNILNKSSVELAKELHLYDPDNHLSGVGFKGDNLHMDSNGHLIYEHANGKPEILLDTNTSEVHDIEVKLTPDHVQNLAAQESPKVSMPTETTPASSVVPITEEPVVVSDMDHVPSTPSAAPVIEKISESTDTNLPVSPSHIPFNNLFVDILEKEGSKVMSFNGQEIAHEHVFGTGKLLTLDDKFQDGAQYKNVREAFVTAFEKQPTNLGGGQLIDTKTFEGGKIYIVQGVDNNPAALKVLLNGKEIAKGVLVGNKPKLDIASNLKASWLVETVYERAFKLAKSSIKTAIALNNVAKK